MPFAKHHLEDDSAPTGLLSHFSGKSKSFANLLDACTMKDLEKSENPFNKRRRILLSSRRSSLYSSFNSKSMPLLRSKSFANLSDACTVKDLEKSENPFNKRRRILLSSRRSSFYSSFNPKSMPLLALEEDEDEEDHHQHRQGYQLSSSSPSSSSLGKKKQEKRGARFLWLSE
ncbi:protein OXIDATIVE STRESS 3 LIKE 4-like [Corylus avellana]|uniref:protein OXIDATIVE STRESS 3 LIKE 4-like n=1 Tax=Corylus avellana TaxID=13451 RepID=UPI00286B871E|nr:protein OXIDATIVE STRESS 3 LIKE 4-like [Corylus avellana]